MQQESNHPSILDILCIGQIMAGKSFFLKQYTHDEAKQKLHSSYDIYAKIDSDRIIYFHQLSEEGTLYLERQYDGILFFIDLLDTWNVVDNILRWLELYSKLTGLNVFKIPIRIIVTKAGKAGSYQKQRISLETELMSIVQPFQTIYFQEIGRVSKQLEQYYEQIYQQKAPGIKQTNENYLKLFGLNQVMKSFVLNAKLTFFRLVEAFNRNIKDRITFQMNFKLK